MDVLLLLPPLLWEQPSCGFVLSTLKKHNLWLTPKVQAFPSGRLTAGVSDFLRTANWNALMSAAGRPCPVVMRPWAEEARGTRTESLCLPPNFEVGSSEFQLRVEYRMKSRESILPSTVLTAGLFSFRMASTFSIWHSTTLLPLARTQQFMWLLLTERKTGCWCTRRQAPYMHPVICCFCAATLLWLSPLMPAALNSRENPSQWLPTSKAILGHGGQCSAPLILVYLFTREPNQTAHN